ncbi:MAG TPA: NADH-quinone oxidoreductase subunit N, partial [Chryseosolibacter sp.]|nr:NADH-quinone oxidoreductase subunit N [Chryseosolibacter sp.]
MLAVNSALGLYYYIKIIAVMFESREGEPEPTDMLRPSAYIVSGVTLSILVGLLIWVGIYPEWIMDVIKKFVNS